MIGVRFLISEWYAMERRYLDFVRVKAVDKKGLDKALLRYVERTVQEHPEVVAIILYGSFPKGTFTPQSDIDLLIVLKESREGILDRIPHFLDPHVFSQQLAASGTALGTRHGDFRDWISAQFYFSLKWRLYFKTI